MMTLNEIADRAVNGTAYEVRLCIQLAYEKGRLTALDEAMARIKSLRDFTPTESEWQGKWSGGHRE